MPSGEKGKLAQRIVIAFFSGTSNTFHMAKFLADELSKLGRDVSLTAMDSPASFSLPEDAALGLSLPVACFSTYPTVWRFIDALPDGHGRGAFLLGTMGGMSAGMDGPVRKVLEGKGYLPLGSKFLVMPGNYGNKTIPAEKNAKRVNTAQHETSRFIKALENGEAMWGSGTPLVSALWARLAHTRKPWKMFYRIFPLTVNGESCTGCGLCRDICPERNVTMEGGTALIGNRCQSCQRCISFCPANAIFVPGKPAEQYRGPSADEMLSLIK